MLGVREQPYAGPSALLQCREPAPPQRGEIDPIGDRAIAVGLPGRGDERLQGTLMGRVDAQVPIGTDEVEVAPVLPGTTGRTVIRLSATPGGA